MQLILLSGGSGKRLWPMSNDSRSKQFLKVLSDQNGNLVSMLQRVWSQLGNLGLTEFAHICASRAQREIIESQVGQAKYIEEPARRDTFPAITLATTYLSDIEHCSDEEVVAVVPIDHLVDNTYFEHICELEDILNRSGADLALMGVQPVEPTSKFGYIRVSHSGQDSKWLTVDSFVEKPERELAARLIREGALWNCGVFCFRVGYLKGILRDRGLPSTYDSLVSQFASLSKRSFDYEVVEQAASIVVHPYRGEWNDLGTWEVLSGEIASEFVGVGTAVECENTHVINELGIPLVALGVQNAMVVATPDGILVADKAHTAALKETVEAYGNRPMFEERRWGSYRVLDYQKLPDATEALTKCIKLSPGKNVSYQRHLKRSEVWTILQGTGEVALDSKIQSIRPGDVIRVHPQQWHAIRAHEPLMFIEVQQGTELIEEDIERRFLDWDDIQAHCAFGV